MRIRIKSPSLESSTNIYIFFWLAIFFCSSRKQLQEESIVHSGFPFVIDAVEWGDDQPVFNPFDSTEEQGQLPAGQQTTDWGFDNQRNPVDFINQASALHFC